MGDTRCSRVHEGNGVETLSQFAREIQVSLNEI